MNELVEENRRSRQVAEEAERSTNIRAELQKLGVAKVDLAYRAVQNDIFRGEDGRLLARPVRARPRQANICGSLSPDNPEFLPARIVGGSGVTNTHRTTGRERYRSGEDRAGNVQGRLGASETRDFTSCDSDIEEQVNRESSRKRSRGCNNTRREMPAITSANVANAIVKLVAADALPALVGNLVMGNLVNRDYEPTLAQAGDTVNVPIPPTLVANNIAEGGTVQTQNPNLGNAQIVLNTHCEATFQIPDVTKVLAVPDLLQVYMRPAVVAIAERIESDLLGLYAGFSANTPLGTAGTRDHRSHGRCG